MSCYSKSEMLVYVSVCTKWAEEMAEETSKIGYMSWNNHFLVPGAILPKKTEKPNGCIFSLSSNDSILNVN